MPVYDYDYGTPGIRPDVAGGAREWLYTASASPNNTPPVYVSGGRVIDGILARDLGNTPDTDTLRPGLPMGRVTASGKYANSIIGATAAAASAAATSITLSAAVAAELVRRIGASGTFKITGPATAGGTVNTETVTYSAVNQTTGVVTVTAITNAYVIASFVRPTDGSEAIKCGLDEWVKVTNFSSAGQDTSARKLCISGFARTTQIIGYPADTALVAWLKAQFNDPTNGPGPFRFDDNF